MRFRLLIVEDDVDLLGALEHTFRAAGYEVISVRNGAEVLSRAHTAKPDLVILDIKLPGMSGFEVCKRLRTEYQQTTLPIIMLSALGNVHDKIKGLEMGADDYVAKPFDLGELQARVRARLESARRLTSTQPTREAYVVGFLGAKGGVGTTTTAANVAAALTLRGQQVVVADLQPWPGAMGLYLGLDSGDAQSRLLALPPTEITPDRVAACLTSYTPGLRVLLPSQDRDANDELTTDRVDALLRSCTVLAGCVVVDLPRPPSSIMRSALLHCSLVVMVVEPLSFCVRLARRTMELVKAWAQPAAGIHAAIVHRVPWATPLATEAVASALGCRLLGVVPPHADLSATAIDSGKLVVIWAPDSIAANALTSLAASIVATLEHT